MLQIDMILSNKILLMNNKVLVIVDMQNDFVTGVLGGELQKGIVQNVCNKIKQAIKDNQFIVFTRDTHYVDYLETREGKHLPIPHCIFGTNGYKLIPEIMELIKSYSNIAFIYKADGFGIISSEIPTEVRLPIYNAKDGFEICGLVTNMCVLSIAVSLQNVYNNLEITIDASCCASFNKELHEKALDIMEGLQMNIINR